MIARCASVILLSLSAIALTAVTAYSHSGGLDGYGCHHDRKNGDYHCHQGTFAGQSFASKNDMLVALETHTQGPSDLRHRVQCPRRSEMPSMANTTFQVSL